MLYSYNGAYPAPLPYTIELSDGTVRHDPTTFTEEELEDAGYVLAPPKPEEDLINEPYMRVTWDTYQWVLVDTRTLESAKDIKLSILSRIRKTKELQFNFMGINILLDEPTQARITGAVSGFSFMPDETISWEVSRGVFVDFNKQSMEALAVAAWLHVKACYQTVKTITAQIQACTTIQEIDSIDLYSGWPQ